MDMNETAQLIVNLAMAYVRANLTEIQPNQGWTNKAFETDMINIGWVKGDEWCADSCILVWKKAYTNKPTVWAVARKLLSANSQLTARNFHADPVWPTSTKLPKLGAIAIWQDGDSLTTGHAGIVVAIDPDGVHFTTAEGNTSSSQFPDIRQGWTYATHVHAINAPHSITGLNLLRFVYAVESYSPLIY